MQRCLLGAVPSAATAMRARSTSNGYVMATAVIRFRRLSTSLIMERGTLQKKYYYIYNGLFFWHHSHHEYGSIGAKKRP